MIKIAEYAPNQNKQSLMQTPGTENHRLPIDRWFYTALAALFLITAIVGFGPNSASILAGSLPMPPLTVHIHAFVMTAWLVLLLTQASLIARRKRRLHQKLGLTSLLLAPAMVVMMVILAFSHFPDGPQGTAVIVIQSRRIGLFVGFFLWAMLVRKTDKESHKRAQFWATVVLLDAALFRMPWLYASGETNVPLAQMYQLCLMAPALAYDLLRFGKIHKVHWFGAGLMLLTTALAGALWP